MLNTVKLQPVCQLCATASAALTVCCRSLRSGTDCVCKALHTTGLCDHVLQRHSLICALHAVTWLYWVHKAYRGGWALVKSQPMICLMRELYDCRSQCHCHQHPTHLMQRGWGRSVATLCTQHTCSQVIVCWPDTVCAAVAQARWRWES